MRGYMFDNSSCRFSVSKKAHFAGKKKQKRTSKINAFNRGRALTAVTERVKLNERKSLVRI